MRDIPIPCIADSLTFDLPKVRVLPWALILALIGLAIWRYSVAAALPLSIDEAYYVAWSKIFDWGYWTKPPAIAWSIGLARGFCGESAGCIRLVPITAFTLSSLTLFACALRMGYEASVSALCALAFATLPLSIFYGIAATTDSLLLLCWALGLWQLHRALNGYAYAWLLVGLAVGLGLLAKYSMAVFVASAALALLHPTYRKLWRTPGPWLAALIALAIFAPNLIWNLTHGSPTLHHTAELSAGGSGYGFHPDALFAFLAAQFGVAGPVLFGAFCVWLTRRPWQHSTDQWLLLCFSLPMLAVMLMQALLSRSHANWATPAYIAMTLAIVPWLYATARRWLVALFAVHLIVAATLYHFDGLIARPFKLSLSTHSDPYWSLRNWPGVIDAIGNAAEARGVRESFSIASGDRAVLAETQAALSLPPSRAFGVLTSGEPAADHFQERNPLPSTPAMPVLLLVTPDTDVHASFPDAQPAGIAASAIIPDHPLSYAMWWIN